MQLVSSSKRKKIVFNSCKCQSFGYSVFSSLMSPASPASGYYLSESVEIDIGHFSISFIVFSHHAAPLYLHLFCIQEREPPNSYTSLFSRWCVISNQSQNNWSSNCFPSCPLCTCKWYSVHLTTFKMSRIPHCIPMWSCVEHFHMWRK